MNDKTDILNAYAAVKTAANGDRILYFAQERRAPQGTANVGFWLLGGEGVGCDASGGTSPFAGTHADGDLQIVSEFSNGGSISSIVIRRWRSGGLERLVTAPSGTRCGDTGPYSDVVCAIVNQAPLTTPWPSPDKSGGALDASLFFEGGINLTRLAERTATEGFPLLTNVDCFASFMSTTRSSTSLTATIFDYTLGAINTCGKITVEKQTDPDGAAGEFAFEGANNGGTALDPASFVLAEPGGSGRRFLDKRGAGVC